MRMMLLRGHGVVVCWIECLLIFDVEIATIGTTLADFPSTCLISCGDLRSPKAKRTTTKQKQQLLITRNDDDDDDDDDDEDVAQTLTALLVFLWSRDIITVYGSSIIIFSSHAFTLNHCYAVVSIITLEMQSEQSLSSKSYCFSSRHAVPFNIQQCFIILSATFPLQINV
jgi:hypothetical protein